MPLSPHESSMQRALQLAERARGRTTPNPIVGAVVVSADGRVVGEGFHERAGAPHAEAAALAAAGALARGATLYVTLEPCDHVGRTPACAPAIVAAGITRVVSAIEDPDPRVRGRGHARLRAAGIPVEAGVLEREAREANAEYFHRVETGRAFVALKAAVTLDGRLAADGGDSRWITGEEARRRAHALRDRYDAVLVGRGTLDRDDPRLDVRLPGGSGRDPVAVVLDSRLAAAPERALWNRAKEGAQVLVATTTAAPPGRVEALRSQGIDVASFPPDSTGRVDLASLLEELARRGMNSVLAEGGETLHTALLAARLVSRAHIFIAPRILGGAAGPRLVGDLGLRRVAESLFLVDPVHEILGSDILVTGRVVDPLAPPIPPAAEAADVHRHHS